jgi:hypothetical protein
MAPAPLRASLMVAGILASSGRLGGVLAARWTSVHRRRLMRAAQLLVTTDMSNDVVGQYSEGQAVKAGDLLFQLDLWLFRLR